MSNPLTPAEVVAWLRKMSKSSCTENRHNYYGADVACYRCGGTGVVVDERYTAAADLIESLADEKEIINRHHEISDGIYERGITDLRAQVDSLGRERDGLAGVVLVVQQALKAVDSSSEYEFYADGDSLVVCQECGNGAVDCNAIEHEAGCLTGKIKAALALTPTAAVAQVEQWRKDSERFQWWLSKEERDISGLMQGVHEAWDIDKWRSWIDAHIAAKEAENGK